MIRTIALSAAITFAMATPVIAQDATPEDSVASATRVAGPVQVNQGEQFLPLRAGQTVDEGDRVMALRSGTATLTFKDGCTLTIEPESIIVVPAVSTCAGGVVTVQATAPAGSQAVGAASSGGVNWSGAALQTAVVVAGAAYMLSEDEEGDDEESEGDTLSP